MAKDFSYAKYYEDESKKKKKKKGKHRKKSKEEISLLKNIDEDIISQYADIRDDIERFQYQLAMADRRTRKKYRKAMRAGKRFNINESMSVKKRKQILHEMDTNNILDRIIRLCQDFMPILKLLSRCASLLIVGLLSFDSVKASVSRDTLEKFDRAFDMLIKV